MCSKLDTTWQQILGTSSKYRTWNAEKSQIMKSCTGKCDKSHIKNRLCKWALCLLIKNEYRCKGTRDHLLRSGVFLPCRGERGQNIIVIKKTLL